MTVSVSILSDGKTPPVLWQDFGYDFVIHVHCNTHDIVRLRNIFVNSTAILNLVKKRYTTKLSLNLSNKKRETLSVGVSMRHVQDNYFSKMVSKKIIIHVFPLTIF
jgi:hypothetical protein